MTPVLLFLLQALFIVVLPPLLTHHLRLRSALPLVVVQIMLGLALGPSLLGHASPELYAALFTPSSLAALSAISSVAVLFFAFTTGMHVSFSNLRGNGVALGGISIASMIVPTVLGCLGGLWLAQRFPGEAGNGAFEFALGIGVCGGVTALPVLAAILREMDLIDQRLGHYALAIAAVNDGAVWILLGVVLAIANTKGASGGALAGTLLALPLYVAVMFVLVRPLLKRLCDAALTGEHRAEAALVTACGVAIGSAAVTELLGLHYVLGAFVAGVVMPESLRESLLERIQPLVVSVLVPFFFISTGLKTHIDITSAAFSEILVVTTTLAIVGKIGGTAIATRLSGEAWSFSLGLGALAQTKGLMEVVVATILLDAGVLSKAAFSAVILMAVISTSLAMPLTRLALQQRWRTTAAANERS